MLYTHTGLDKRKTSWHLAIVLAAVNFFLASVPTAAADKTAADYYVHSLPGQPDGPLLRMHAGHVEITPEHNGNLFFWHYENRHIANRPRTVIWLNGGPGCSSEDGGLMELGPYRVEDGGKLRYNNGSWDEFANLLFVDNPVGTGFSYVNGDAYTQELQEMSDQFVTFLEKWFTIFPEYEHDDLYIAGESYAGQYIPYIAKTILDRNTKLDTADPHRWNLMGLLIGNGWISPVDHYMSYTTFAYETGLIQGGTKEADKVEKVLSDCLSVLGKPEAQDQITVPLCEGVLSKILDVTRTSDDRCPNMYDVRLTDTFPACGMNWPPDLETVTPYLRRQDVVAALHINREKREGWSECSGAVSSHFRAVNSKPSVQLLPGLLEAGLPIVLFSGDKDMICNHVGTETMIEKMKWNGGKGFELSPGVTAPQTKWEVEGEAAGIYQEARNLTYVKFYNSSHMVPFDYSRRSRAMLDKFMGVDISYLGGLPTGSNLDDVQTGTGQQTNTTQTLEEEKDKLRKAELKAYYRSGETALVVVVIAAAIFGWWVWRQRKRNGGWGKNEGGLGSYMSVPGTQPMTGPNGPARGKGRRDLEAGDFDEAELDNLQTNGRAKMGEHEQGPYDLASDSDEDDEEKHRTKAAGR